MGAAYFIIFVVVTIGMILVPLLAGLKAHHPIDDVHFKFPYEKDYKLCVMCNGILSPEYESKNWKGSHEWCDDCY
jgi:hypothetical protein